MLDNTQKMKVQALTDIPAARDYLARIQAEPRGLRAAVVQEAQGRDKKDVCRIQFDTDGTVTVRSDDGNAKRHEPTDAEQQQIIAEFAAAKWPEPKPLYHLINELPEMKEAVEGVTKFIFREVNGKIVMVQLLIDNPAGGNSYLPYTYWNDDKWRCMEPDGPLPLYNAHLLKKGSTTVIIHAGAKAAHHCQWMADGALRATREAREAHPWGKALCGVAHVGWIGGDPHRTDWTVLARRRIDQVYIVGDNDEPGNSAARLIAEQLRIPTSLIQFTDEWPVGFNLADDWPDETQRPEWWERMADGQCIYNGPAFHSCVHPVTRAADLPRDRAKQQKKSKSGSGRTAPEILPRDGGASLNEREASMPDSAAPNSAVDAEFEPFAGAGLENVTARDIQFTSEEIAAAKANVDLAELIGEDVELKPVGRSSSWQGLCPFHDERTPSFTVYPDNYRCFGCGAHGDAIDWLTQQHGMTFDAAVTELQSRDPREQRLPAQAAASAAASNANREMAERIWSASLPPQGTLVEVYLRSRGLMLPQEPVLRFHPQHYHSFSGTVWPAMIARMVDPVTGEPRGIHRTWLKPDGSGKAPVKPAKAMLGPSGTIRLCALADTQDVTALAKLGIAEGIETALAVTQVFGWGPVWAAGSAGGIERFPVLPGVKLTVFADNDDGGVGLRAAERCCERWRAEGGQFGDPTRTIWQAPKGEDWADAARRAPR